MIPKFLHMSWDGPKPQALTQAAVPEPAAKIYCEEYSCSLSKSAPFGFIAEEHKVLRENPCGPNRQTYDSIHYGKHWTLNRTLRNVGYQWRVYQNSQTQKVSCEYVKHWRVQSEVCRCLWKTLAPSEVPYCFEGSNSM